MNFKGSEGGPISRSTATNWIKNYKETQIEKDPEKTLIKGHFFGKEQIQKLLDEPESKGIRIYYGLDENGDQKLLLVAANSEMDDILPAEIQDSSADGPMILDISYPCPPYCPKEAL